MKKNQSKFFELQLKIILFLKINKAQFMFEDFYNSWMLMVILLVVAGIVSFLYIIIMRWVLGKILIKINLIVL